METKNCNELQTEKQISNYEFKKGHYRDICLSCNNKKNELNKIIFENTEWMELPQEVKCGTCIKGVNYFLQRKDTE